MRDIAWKLELRPFVSATSLEEEKRKLTSRVGESEIAFQNAKSKGAQLEKEL